MVKLMGESDHKNQGRQNNLFLTLRGQMNTMARVANINKKVDRRVNGVITHLSDSK